jgi:hypothetical protein
MVMAFMGRFEASAHFLGDGHAGGVALRGERLGQDAERDLGRGLRAEIEPDRHAHSRERLLADPVLAQQVQDRGPAAGAAEQADVANRRAQRVAQHRQVVLVVVGHQDQRGGRDQRHLRDQLGRHADPQVVHVGKALPGGEPRAAVHHDGAEAERLGHRGQRHRDVARPDHQERGGGREHLGEGAHVLEEQRARLAGGQGLAGLGLESLVEEGVAQRALPGAGVEEQQLGPVVRRIQARDDHRAAARLGVGARPVVEHHGGAAARAERDRLHEDLDRPPAGQPDLPGLLVAQVQLEQARRVLVQHVGGFLDDLRVHAPADGHRAEHAPALAHQHLRPLLAGRGAAGVDQRGHRHLGLALVQLIQMTRKLAHVCLGYLSLRCPARSRRLARLCAAAKWSTSGNAAAMPRVRGS